MSSSGSVVKPIGDVRSAATKMARGYNALAVSTAARIVSLKQGKRFVEKMPVVTDVVLVSGKIVAENLREAVAMVLLEGGAKKMRLDGDVDAALAVVELLARRRRRAHLNRGILGEESWGNAGI